MHRVCQAMPQGFFYHKLIFFFQLPNKIITNFTPFHSFVHSFINSLTYVLFLHTGSCVAYISLHLLYSQGWAWMPDPHASASQVLRKQVSASMPNSVPFFRWGNQGSKERQGDKVGIRSWEHCLDPLCPYK